jgi:hypothetical protein
MARPHVSALLHRHAVKDMVKLIGHVGGVSTPAPDDMGGEPTFSAVEHIGGGRWGEDIVWVTGGYPAHASVRPARGTPTSRVLSITRGHDVPTAGAYRPRRSSSWGWLEGETGPVAPPVCGWIDVRQPRLTVCLRWVRADG